MDIRSDVKKLAFDDEGVQLMVQYSEREQQEQGKCVVLKIED